MTQTIAIAPVRKSVLVKAPQQKAFDVFTSGVDRWWPKTHGIGTSALLHMVIEPHKGGRWFGKYEDGSEIPNGHVLVWEPPGRVVFSWEINSQWKSDRSIASEVEIRFVAEGPGTTRVELEHRKFEVLGKEGGEKMRGDVNGGWVGMLELFKNAAEV